MLVAVDASWSQDNQLNEQLKSPVNDKYTENIIGFIEIGQVKMQSLISERWDLTASSHIITKILIFL